MACAKRHLFGHHRFAEPAFGHAGAEQIGDLINLVLGGERPAPTSMRHFLAVVEHLSGRR